MVSVSWQEKRLTPNLCCCHQEISILARKLSGHGRSVAADRKKLQSKLWTLSMDP